jgi:hypothetical protein
MTRLYIDTQEVASLPVGLNSIEEIINLVESKYLPLDMLIQQIQVDGIPLDVEDPVTCSRGSICHGDKIEIFTASLRQVAVDSINEAASYLDRIEMATPSLTKSLRVQPGMRAYENLKQFYEGFYCVNLLLNRLEQSFQIPFADIKISGGTAQSYCMMLASLLKEIIDAHEKRDFGLLADLLEYEISPRIPVCKEILAALRGRILAEP